MRARNGTYNRRHERRYQRTDAAATRLRVRARVVRFEFAAARTAIVFEIVCSYGIAAAEFLQVRGLDFRNVTWIGLSWLAVWSRELVQLLMMVPIQAVWTPDLARAWWEQHQPVPA